MKLCSGDLRKRQRTGNSGKTRRNQIFVHQRRRIYKISKVQKKNSKTTLAPPSNNVEKREKRGRKECKKRGREKRGDVVFQE
jgi:hypothetical protein